MTKQPRIETDFDSSDPFGLWDDWNGKPTYPDVDIPDDSSGLERVRNVLSDGFYAVVERAKALSGKGRAAAAGAVVVGILTTGVGANIGTKSYREHRAEDAALVTDTPEQTREYVFTDLDHKVGDLNKDPGFRASSVSVMKEGSLLGSGGLIKVNGDYVLATAEHVARPLFGMPETIPEGGAGGITIGDESDAKDDRQANMFVPGVGVIKLSGNEDDVAFHGNEASKDSSDITDRFTTIKLSGAVQRILKDAEDKGEIKVPKLVEFDAEAGDVFWMPLADTGKMMPFIYINDRSEENTRPRFVPLVIFDSNLDTQAAVDRFLSDVDADIEEYIADMEEQKAEFYEQEGGDFRYEVDPSVSAWAVARDTGVEFGKQHQSDDFESENGVTEWLPCLGDSGSPLLDAKGNVVGMLSAGSPFSSGKSDVHLTRHGLLNFDCLADAVFVTPPK